MELLRFSTAGSVDDGKSTLIGRLLFDSKAIPDDQYEAIKRASQSDDGGVDLALLTDGLRAEREQKITIDVAYRYFATPKRRFIIADTPGHAQYTRNMVTGASTAHAAVILVDARNGLLEQSRRHAALSALLRVPHLAVAINKMDLVNFDEGIFRRIEAEFAEFASKLGVTATAIPLSALAGDNVVDRSGATPYYDGPSLLEWLESLPIAETRGDAPFRLPVQCVIRPHQNFRGFAGRVAGGSVRPGDPILVLPSGKRSQVKELVTADGPLADAHAGESVVLTLTDEVDISRGDLLTTPVHPPAVARRFVATVCVLSEAGLAPGRPYIATHTTRQAAATVDKIDFRLAVETLTQEDTNSLALNELGQVTITLAQPLLLDPYAQSRELGGFLLLDPATSVPVAAGMVLEVLPDSNTETATAEPWSRAEREQRHGHRGGLVVVPDRATAATVERRLAAQGWHTAFVESTPTDAFAQNGIIVLTLGALPRSIDEQLAALRLPNTNLIDFGEGI